jgi:uncharacterized protein (DUF1684 family)
MRTAFLNNTGIRFFTASKCWRVPNRLVTEEPAETLEALEQRIAGHT